MLDAISVFKDASPFITALLALALVFYMVITGIGKIRLQKKDDPRMLTVRHDITRHDKTLCEHGSRIDGLEKDLAVFEVQQKNMQKQFDQFSKALEKQSNLIIVLSERIATLIGKIQNNGG